MEKEIKSLVKKYLNEHQKSRNYIPASGKVYDDKELVNLVKASLEGWWTEGVWTEKFETKIKDYLGVKNVLACNSGSSANLLALSTLCSVSLEEDRIKSGSEIITVAAGFPTTVNAIIQNNCIPVFVDVEIPTYNIDINLLKKALSKKTRAVMVAHTLGNPFDLSAVKNFCKKHRLWLIEDNCDALGAEYKGKKTGTFGDIATLSFYPAHHITAAEGGAVLTNNAKLAKITRSIRDWGRHCWCPTGKDNTCKNRYNWQLGSLPHGYDHKYIYGEIGYNLKISDLHSAIGLAQMTKLEKFVEKRRDNFNYLNQKMAKLANHFVLPEATKNSNPSWFGYLLTIRDDRIDRTKLLKYLEENGVGSRLLFGGNITRQPYFVDNKEIKYRIVGKLKNSDIITGKTFWLGLYPALGKSDLDKTYEIISQYLSETL